MLAIDHARAVWAGVPLIVALSQGAYAFAPAVFGVLRTLSGQEPHPLFWFLALAAGLQAAAIACLAWGRSAARQRRLQTAGAA